MTQIVLCLLQREGKQFMSAIIITSIALNTHKNIVYIYLVSLTLKYKVALQHNTQTT